MESNSTVKPTETAAQGEPQDDLSSPEPFRLLPDNESGITGSSSLEDLLTFHDKAFVINAYSTLMGLDTEPEELARALEDLRGGKRTKTAIIEDIAATHHVQIKGLSSPAMRRLRQTPFLGYAFRVLRAFARLPRLIQNQQQFESYIIGQQQRIADYVNEVTRLRETSTSVAGLNSEEAETLSDTVATVMMLSDSVIELSSLFSQAENQLQNLQAEQQNTAREFRSGLSNLSKALQRNQEQLTCSIQELQQHLERVTTSIQTIQRDLDELQRSQHSTAVAQREFLLNEQHAVVEAERAAINDLQTQIDRAAVEKEEKIAELQLELRQLREVVDEFNQGAARK